VLKGWTMGETQLAESGEGAVSPPHPWGALRRPRAGSDVSTTAWALGADAGRPGEG